MAEEEDMSLQDEIQLRQAEMKAGTYGVEQTNVKLSTVGHLIMGLTEQGPRLPFSRTPDAAERWPRLVAPRTRPSFASPRNAHRIPVRSDLPSGPSRGHGGAGSADESQRAEAIQKGAPLLDKAPRQGQPAPSPRRTPPGISSIFLAMPPSALAQRDAPPPATCAPPRVPRQAWTTNDMLDYLCESGMGFGLPQDDEFLVVSPFPPYPSPFPHLIPSLPYFPL